MPGKHGNDATETKRPLLDARNYTPLDETSIRYDGWRIVVVCFLLATFGWGLGFYGQSVYVAELQRLHGWPASLISSGTTFFYLFGAALVAFVSEAIKAFGPRNCMIAGICTMAAAAISIGQVREPWQLYLANAVLAFGWAGTSLGIITNTLGLWFDKKRGMAISLALNGASFGGIAGVPLLVMAIGHFGFSGAMTASAVVMVVVMVPVILLSVGRPPVHASAGDVEAADAPSPTQIRARAFRDIGFLSVSAAFALVLFAQVGFIVHLISFLDSVIGRQQAAIAMALLTAMAVVGRVLFSFVIDRMNQRLASALSFVSQAIALLIVINVHHDYALIAACALFGFSVGNLITLPALIVQREFDPRSFGVLVSLITAINQITYAFGPGVVGLLRDLSGSYTLPFYGCIAVELTAAVLIMIRGRGRKSVARRSAAISRDRAFDATPASGLRIGSSCASRLLTMRSYALPLPQQLLQIQPFREHRQRSIRRARPFFLRPVAVELDAVLVGIAQIQRLADAVVAGAVELDAGLDHAIQRIRQRRARGIENGGVKQPGGAWRRRMAALAFPGVEADVMVIAAGRNERRTGAHPLHHLEAEHAAIEPQRAFEIGDLEMDMPDAGAGNDGWVLGHVVSLRNLTSPRMLRRRTLRDAC